MTDDHSSVKIHSSWLLVCWIELFFFKPFLVSSFQPGWKKQSLPLNLQIHDEGKERLWDSYPVFDLTWMDIKKTYKRWNGYTEQDWTKQDWTCHPSYQPGCSEGYVLVRGLMWFLACLNYDVRDLLYAVSKVTMLAPGKLWRHQQLPCLVDAVLVLWWEGGCWHRWMFDLIVIKIIN